MKIVSTLVRILNALTDSAFKMLCILLSVIFVILLKFLEILHYIRFGCCGTFTCFYYSNVFTFTTPRGVSSLHWLGQYIFSPCLYSCTYLLHVWNALGRSASLRGVVGKNSSVGKNQLWGEIYKISRLSDPPWENRILPFILISLSLTSKLFFKLLHIQSVYVNETFVCQFFRWKFSFLPFQIVDINNKKNSYFINWILVQFKIVNLYNSKMWI